jgi:hypothetical protein
VINKPSDSVEDRPEKLHRIPSRIRRLVHHGCESLSLFLTADHQDSLLDGQQNGRPQYQAVIGHDRRNGGIDQGIVVIDRKINFAIIN